jgi:hypothetical protein
VNVAVTGLNVPGGYPGIVTFAFVAETTVKLCSPMNELSPMSTVTLPGPAVIESNTPALPGETSVIVNDGVHVPAGGVGVGVGVGVAGGVGVAVGVGVGVGVGVAVGVGVGVGGGGPPEHCARIRSAFVLAEALNVKSTGCPGFGTVNVAVTGLNVPCGNAGMFTFAFVELTTVNP